MLGRDFGRPEPHGYRPPGTPSVVAPHWDRLGDRQDTGLLEEQLHRCRSNVYPKGGAPACSIPTGKRLPGDWWME